MGKCTINHSALLLCKITDGWGFLSLMNSPTDLKLIFLPMLGRVQGRIQDFRHTEPILTGRGG